MKNIINISTGEVKMGTPGDFLVSYGIGSCIVIAGINIETNKGAVAHVMLPDKAPENEIQHKTKYAENAVDKLLQLLQAETEGSYNIRTCLVGAGNVLFKQDDTLCKKNIYSVLRILNNRKINIGAQSLGGSNRRTLSFDIQKREVHITEGDSNSILFIRW